MKIQLKISLFWKLLLLCGGLIIMAAITQHILIKFLLSPDAMRKLYLQKWQISTMQQQFRQNVKNSAIDEITQTHGGMITASFADFILPGGYLISIDEQPYLRLYIDSLAVVDLDGELISQLGQPTYQAGNLFTQLSLEAREDLVEALIGKDFFGSSTETSYQGVTVAISLLDENKNILGALVIKQRRILSDNLTGLYFGFKQVVKGIIGFVISLLFACLFFALVMAYYLNRRIKKITSAVQKWQQGDFNQRIVDHASDELALCSQGLNTMADSLQQAILKEANLAAEQERQQLAIELHDTVKQRLFATNLKVALCEKLLIKQPEQVAKLLPEITWQCQQAFTELQQTIEALRLQESKTWFELIEFTQHWQLQHNIALISQYPENWQPGQQLTTLLWRIITEALQNIVKHADASEVNLIINQGDEELCVKVQDNGSGCMKSTVFGQGLTLLSARITQLGGSLTLSVNPVDGLGSELLLLLPINCFGQIINNAQGQLNDN